MQISESGITLVFPDNNYFRFEDCTAYKEIQQNFKEMDVCWYDQESNVLYLIELKDWGDNRLLEEDDPSFSDERIAEIKKSISKSRVNVLVKKSVDSVSMFLSILLGKPYAAKIQECMPFHINHDTQIKLLSIINWTNADTSYIANMNSAYKSKFRPYATLFHIKTYIVLTKNQASDRFEWVLKK